MTSQTSAESDRREIKTDSVDRLDHLDLLRGIAALLVLTSHLRIYLFQNYGDLDPAYHSLVTQAFYFATALGHQAVLAFFALSGYLVGGRVLCDLCAGGFDWTSYLSRRLIRLWIVIIPALLLTWALDVTGAMLTGGIGYDGRFSSLYNSGPPAHGGIAHDIATFVGNVAFLQTIEVSYFGSNSPLWSLANELWYYVVFPLAAWLVLAAAPWQARLAGAAILMSLIYFLPSRLWIGGAVWLAGAAAAWSTMQPGHASFWSSAATRAFALCALLSAVVLSKVPALVPGDVAFGLIVAAALPVLALLPSPGGIYRRTARGASEISYSLYLTHFPLLTLLVFWSFGGTRFMPGVEGALVYLALLAVAIIWAALVWWCFERNTHKVHSWLRAAFASRTRAVQESR